MTKNLSVVVPLLNERPSLAELHRELRRVCIENSYNVEIIFIDDGSSDDSWSEIERIAESDQCVFGIRLRRNFGKAAAISAGAFAANHEYIVTIDADLQDDPAEIPKFFAEMEKGFDVVSGWKQVRRDPLNRRLASRAFNLLVNCLTKVRLHDHNCGFKLYRSEVFNEVDLYGGFHRFIPVLAAARGFRIGEVAVNHRPRKHGHSKYGFLRFVQGVLDLMTICFLTGYSQRPQHLMGLAGLVSFFLGLIGLTYMGVYWIVRMTASPELTPLHQRPIVLYSVAALLLGTQLLTMGFLAELMVAKDQKRGRRFSIRETTKSVAGCGENGRSTSSADERVS